MDEKPIMQEVLLGTGMQSQTTAGPTTQALSVVCSTSLLDLHRIPLASTDAGSREVVCLASPFQYFGSA